MASAALPPYCNGAARGQCGIGDRNARGHWLAERATAQKLAIANTMTEKTFEEQWTCENDGARRQLDYCLLDARKARAIENAEANDDIVLGHDHRAVKVAIKMNEETASAQPKQSQPRRRNLRRWRPCNNEENRKQVDLQLHSLFFSGEGGRVVADIDQRCRQIETILLDVAAACHERGRISAEANEAVKKNICTI